MIIVVLMGTLLALTMALALWLSRHMLRAAAAADQLSLVTRQHIHLFQGGQLNEAVVEKTKVRLRQQLERGEIAAVEGSLRPGPQYIVQLRALTEIGTDQAALLLERQLLRRLSKDPLEQSWYWIDLAHSLRQLHREESLPQLLQCAATAGDFPLGYFLAAEIICFPGFAKYLSQPDTHHGKMAWRLLHRTLEGLRNGVPLQVIAEAHLGEMVEKIWDQPPTEVTPLAVRLALESLRLLRLSPHLDKLFADENLDQEALNWQMSRLAALESVWQQYLRKAPLNLVWQMTSATMEDWPDLLAALNDLRVDTRATLLPWLDRADFGPVELALEVLTWSRDLQVGAKLRSWAQQRVPMAHRAQGKRRAATPSRSSLPADIPYRGILRALRGHGSKDTESFLLLAAQDWDPLFRAAAIGSLGWWEPLNWSAVIACLQQSRRDPAPEVRQAARSALARMGECQALQWFRQALTCENSQQVHDTIKLVAAEGLTLLWPDLDRLADADNPDIAFHACEALEWLREEMVKQPV